jgi:Protein of unknown function (DUF3325)
VADAWVRIAALLCSICGMSWFALAMKAHWRQLRHGQTLMPRTQLQLRGLGAIALVAALLMCMWADHPSMAALVWTMALAGSALSVALTLAWRPHWLAWLVVWVSPRGPVD